MLPAMLRSGQAPPLNLALAPRAQNQRLVQQVTDQTELGAQEEPEEPEGFAVQEVTYQWSVLDPGVAVPAGDLDYDRDAATGRVRVRRKLWPVGDRPIHRGRRDAGRVLLQASVLAGTAHALFRLRGPRA